MAIWQYTFHVLPKESVEILPADSYFEKEEDGFDDEFYWEMESKDKHFFHFMKEILPKNKSWSNKVDLYGNQESNCFEVLSNNEGKVISVSFRIDFRNNYEKVLSQIIEFCYLNGLIIIDELLKRVAYNYEQVQNIIESSPQIKRYRELG